MNAGMEPDIKAFLRKVLNTLSMGLLWLMLNLTLGIYFKLGIPDASLHWYHILFYLFFLASLFFLLRYYYRIWRD